MQNEPAFRKKCWWSRHTCSWVDPCVLTKSGKSQNVFFSKWFYVQIFIIPFVECPGDKCAPSFVILPCSLEFKQIWLQKLLRYLFLTWICSLLSTIQCYHENCLNHFCLSLTRTHPHTHPPKHTLFPPLGMTPLEHKVLNSKFFHSELISKPDHFYINFSLSVYGITILFQTSFF